MPTPNNTGSGPRSLQDIKELVKDRVDFVELVGRYTKLTKSGHRFKGCCPFHKEKTPSFYVNPQENFFHCFGCEVGGDVFSFLMKAEGLSFMESLKELAESLHIEIPTSAKFADEKRGDPSERAMGYELLDRAAHFYHRVLMGGVTPGAKQALAYLKKRGISDDELESLVVGWAPESGNELLRKLGAEKDMQIAGKVGLVRQGQNGLYEFFRSRIMIPIRDPKGRTCAFSGRTMTEVTGQNPKYKNSSESEWFKKKEVLYGLDRAAKLIREEEFVCLVEGYFDQWAFQRHGIPAVAVMGTALSEEHLKLLGRYTQRAVLVLDADQAGIDSTLKVIPMFLKHQWNVSVFSGLEGKDPDEWLGQHAEAAQDLKSKLLTSPEALEWWTKLILNESLLKGIGRLETYRNVAVPWKFAMSKAHRSVLADEIGRILGLPSREVWASLNELAQNADHEPRNSSAAESVAAPVIAPKRGLVSEERLWTKSPLEEAFVWWIRYWDQITPATEAGWREMEAVFAKTAVEPVVAQLSTEAAQNNWSLPSETPKRRLEDSRDPTQIQHWIQKGLVLRDQVDGRPDQDNLLISFKEITSILTRERVHGEIARLQSMIRSAGPSAEDSSKLLQRVQELRLSLDKPK